jgi:hypothetical protein
VKSWRTSYYEVLLQQRRNVGSGPFEQAQFECKGEDLQEARRDALVSEFGDHLAKPLCKASLSGLGSNGKGVEVRSF